LDGCEPGNPSPVTPFPGLYDRFENLSGTCLKASDAFAPDFADDILRMIFCVIKKD
jgi:hypothetical protein